MSYIALPYPDPEAALFLVRSLLRICTTPADPEHSPCNAALDELEAMTPARRRACEHELFTVLNAWGLILAHSVDQTLPDYLRGLEALIERSRHAAN